MEVEWKVPYTVSEIEKEFREGKESRASAMASQRLNYLNAINDLANALLRFGVVDSMLAEDLNGIESRATDLVVETMALCSTFGPPIPATLVLRGDGTMFY